VTLAAGPPEQAPAATALLEVTDLRVAYGEVEVLHGISFTVNRGEIVTLIGANGAGKTTTMKTIAGVLEPRGGHLLYEGRDLAGRPSHECARLGISMVPEGRRVFPQMTVLENLELGGYRFRRDRQRLAGLLDGIFELFPRLAERRRQQAGTLSGGEQQMLALGRALMSRPRLLLLDEPSLGLAPLVVREFFRVVRELNEKEGLTVLVVEQDARIALSSSSRAYVLEVGRVALSGTSDDLRDDESVRRSYLGY
jgi:branched-chain amino acid transport system ATP-binding protein